MIDSNQFTVIEDISNYDEIFILVTRLMLQDRRVIEQINQTSVYYSTLESSGQEPG